MKNQNTKTNYTPIQLKLPIDFTKIIDISDPVYTFNEVMEHIDPRKYFAEKEGCKMGRPRYPKDKLLKVVLFAFNEEGYCSIRRIKKLCDTDVRFMWLLDEEESPSFMTIENFMKDDLAPKLDAIMADINRYIFEQESVDLKHVYLDGTKIEANANKYTWVWNNAINLSIVKGRINRFAP